MGKEKKSRSISEINGRIKNGEATVVTAEEMVDIVNEKGEEKAAEEVDVVTTGTFGAMCSSGAWLNFGHADPPIKFRNLWINDVEAYTGVAAVDAYIGASQPSETEGIEYGGSYVIEDIVRGKEIELRGNSPGTDCYPRREIETSFTKSDLNQAVLCNPRNAYQKYNAATNSRNETIYTYMGTLLPNYGNVSFSGSGELSPLNNDPNYETLGPGTRIFIGGAHGHIFWEGTQHNPKEEFGTIMTVGDLKEMDPEYLRGVTVEKYGVSLFLGIGVPIPVLNERIAKTTGRSDEEITTSILDYGIPRRDKPKEKEVTYAELKSGEIEFKGNKTPVSPMSSLKKAREIAEKLKEEIKSGKFLLSSPIERLSRSRRFKPMKHRSEVPLAKDLMTRKVTTAKPEDSIESASRAFDQKGFDHLPIIDDENKLRGIVTSWDVAVAVGKDKKKLSEILTSNVVTALENEPVDSIARKLQKHKISGLPVVDSEQKLKGIVTGEDLSRLIGG